MMRSWSDDDDDECKLAGSSPNVCRCTYICKGFGLPNVAEFPRVRIHLSSSSSFCLLSFSLSCFHLFFFLLGSSMVVLSAQFWSGTQGTLIARLGFSLYWTLRLWQLRETYLSFHFCPFVCVCCEKWKHGKLNAFCYFQTQRILFSILLYNCVLQTGPATKWLCVGAQWNVLPAANYSNGQMW